VQIDHVHLSMSREEPMCSDNTPASKKATNRRISSDLPAEAPRQKQQEQWLAENRKAISAYNDDVRANGVFSDGLRSF